MKNNSSLCLVSEVDCEPAAKSRIHFGHQPLKRLCDILGSGLLLILSAPIMAFAALLVRLTSRGPVFYTQTRMGLLGKPFTIYKLRSMVVDSESTTGAVWATHHDPRITPVGKFLRLSHIDELPQLWNVLKGDMSLVGPRPERPEFLPALKEAFPEYPTRLRVRPGITGLAQVQLSADTDLSSVGRKLAYDCYYAKRLTVWLDARIIACTCLYVFLEVPLRIARELLLLLDNEVLEQDFRVVMEGANEVSRVE